MAVYKLTQQSGNFAGTSHSDFPAFLKPSEHAALGSLSQAQADSSRFFTDSGLSTEIPREIVDTDQIHFKVPTFTSGDEIWVDIDGTSSDYADGATNGRNNVWTDYQGVYHLEDHTSLVDSTGNGNTGSAGGTLSTTNDHLGNGVDFSSGYMEISFTHSTGGLKGIMGWTRDWAMNEDIFSQAGSSNYAFNIFTGNGTVFNSWMGGSSHTLANFLTQGQTLHFVNQYDGTDEYLYIDGAETAQSPATVSAPGDGGTNFNLGRWFGSANNDAGVWDEFRTYDDVNFSANYIETTYNNQNSPSTFWSVEEVEEVDDRRVFNIS